MHDHEFEAVRVLVGDQPEPDGPVVAARVPGAGQDAAEGPEALGGEGVKAAQPAGWAGLERLGRKKANVVGKA